MPDPLVGRVLHERYRVLRRIGRGGMGVVYLAEHVLIGRKYALKTLNERDDACEERVARFHREALAAAAVGSEHVVEVTDMGRLDDGSYFLVMEYLEGVELAEAVYSKGRFAAGRAAHIAHQLCTALGAVHQKGIVHRDLKPENLFLIERHGDADFLKVLDFGVCKLAGLAPVPQAADRRRLTRTNASLGTPQFMAPEQFQASARADHRADLHAVGAILFFMLTGDVPFDAPTLPELFMRICVEPPPSLRALRPDLPAGLVAVVERALRKNPFERFESAAALADALRPYLALADDGALSSHLPQATDAPERPLWMTTQPAVDHLPLPSVTPHAAASSDTSFALPVRPLRRSWGLAGALAAMLSLLALGAWTRERTDAAPRPTTAEPPRASAAEVASGAAPLVTLDPAPRVPAFAPAPSSPYLETPSKAGAAGPHGLRARREPSAASIRASDAAADPAPSDSQAKLEMQPELSAAPSAEVPVPPAPQTDAAHDSKNEPYAFPRRGLKDVF